MASHRAQGAHTQHCSRAAGVLLGDSWEEEAPSTRRAGAGGGVAGVAGRRIWEAVDKAQKVCGRGPGRTLCRWHSQSSG